MCNKKRQSLYGYFNGRDPFFYTTQNLCLWIIGVVKLQQLIAKYALKIFNRSNAQILE